MPTPSTWQSSSILLRRAGDPEFASTTITSTINASTTTVTVANAAGAGIVVGKLVKIDDEKVRVTGVSTNTLTVTRGAEGTTAASHASNTQALALLDRVSGLELRADAPNGSWPTLQVRGGVRLYSNFIIPTQDLSGNPFRMATASPLGQISAPGQSAPTPTETSDWSYAKLSYSGQFDLTLSRLTPAALIETSATALRMCSGTTTKRTTNGTTITETAAQNILPKYVAWHESDGYHVGTISTTPIDLSAMDQPWIMVWFGNQSHWVDTTIPTNAQTSWTFPLLPQRYAVAADAPILLTFSANPTAIARDATAASGFDLTLPSGAKKISVLPLYGRTRPAPATTETWSTPANLPQAQIQAWYPRTGQFPASASETYAYTAGTDTATVTRTVTWTQVLASGSSKFCPIPPVVGIARDAAPTGLVVSGTIVDGAIPTEYGPTLGVVGVDTVTWTYAGLAPYTVPRAALGAGAVPAPLQARLNAEIDALVAQSEWAPWFIGPRIPNIVPGGDVYWSNSADTLSIVSEIASSASGTRRANLLTWLRAYRTLRPPESSTNYNLSATTGTARGTFGTPGTMAAYWSAQLFLPTAKMFEARQSIWAAWGYARYYQETGDAVDSAVVAALVNLIDTDMAEHDAATLAPMAGLGAKQTVVENANRMWAGLAGLAWLCAQVGDTTNEQLCRALLARYSVLRIALGHLPRWQASVGLITTPNDLGSAASNQKWNATFSSSWLGWLYMPDWATSADDPRIPVTYDQHRAWLDDHTYRFGWQEGGTRAHIPVHRSMVRPLARFLAAVAPVESTVYSKKYRALNPQWNVPYADGIYGGENQFVQPADSYGLLLSRAWMEGAPADTLEREAASPWLSGGGDLFGAHKLAEAVRAYAGDALGTEPVISAVADNRATYAGSLIPLYSPLIVTCQVATNTTRDVYIPYDASAPHANDRNGISVDLQISTDPGFGSYQTQPFAWIEDWDRQTKNYGGSGAYDWSYPIGAGRWQAGWQPEATTGTYYYRIRAADAGGATIGVTSTVTVTTAQVGRHGSVRVSTSDNRYLERADRTQFSGVGAAFQPRLSTSDNVVNWHIPHLQAMAQNGVKWMRIWASTWGIWGDYQPEFSHARTSTTAFIYQSQLTASVAYPMPTGPEYATYCSDYNFPLWGFLHNGLSVKRSTTYRVRAEVAITGALNGPLVVGDTWGLCFKYGAIGSTFPIQQISYGGQTVWWPVKPGNGTVVGNTFVQGPTTGGTYELIDFGTLTTGSTQDYLGYFYPAVQSVGSPTQPVYIKRIYVQEDVGGGAYGPNLIGVAPSDMHKQINQRFADGFDRMVATAEQYGAVLKVVMNEKDQFAYGAMDTSGNMSLAWASDRFWGASGSRNRWLHAAIARYFQGRWGYSPAVTWEFVNEGNPGLDAHFTAANDWATALEPWANAKPTNTSTSGTSYRYDKMQLAPHLKIGDYHGYQGAGRSLSIPTTGAPGGSGLTIATVGEYYDVAGAIVRSGPLGAAGSFGIGKPVVRGEQGWYPGSDANVVQPMTEAAHTALVHKHVWAQVHSGGGLHHIWHTATYVYDPADNVPNNLGEFARFGAWYNQFPLNLGGYTDAAATSSNPSLRVVGQKNAVTNRCHVWVDNAGTSGDLDDTAHNWRTVNAGLTPTARSATIAIPGLGANVTGTLYRYDTYAGTEDDGTTATVGPNGVLAISVSGLSTDTAFRFEPLPAPPSPGGAPTGILAAAGINSVTVSWSAPTGWTTSITSYEVEVTNATLGTVATQSTPNVLVWPVTGLSSAYVYTFRVRAISNALVGGYSVASQEVSPVALGGYMKDMVLTWFKGTNTDAAPATVYWSLHTADPGKTGASEVSTSGTAYARKSMATSSGFSAIADGTGTKRRITNAGAITFNVPTASWGTVTHAGCWDALTGGNFLGGGVLAQSAAIGVPQDAPKFNTGQLAVELD